MKYFLYALLCVLVLSCTETTPSLLKESGLVKLVPRNASVIIKINDFNKFKEQLEQNSFLKKLKNTTPYKATNTLLSSLKHIQPKGTSLIALNEIGKETHDFTFITKQYEGLFQTVSISDKQLTTITYQDTPINIIELADEQLYSIVYNGYFIGSSSKLIIENLIRSLGQFTVAVALEKLYKTSQDNVVANVFVNHKKGTALFKKLVNNKVATTIETFNSWTSFDVSLHKEYMKFTGLALTTSIKNNEIYKYVNKQPIVPKAQKIVPVNVVSFTTYTSGNGLPVQQTKDSLFSEIVELVDIQFEDERAYAVRPNNTLVFEDLLKTHIQKKETYKDVSIGELRDQELLHAYFYKVPDASMFKANYVVQLGDFYVFTSNKPTIENIISNFQNNATLQYLPAYINLKEELAAASSVLFVGDISKLKGHTNILNNKIVKELKREDFTDYKFVALQFVTETDYAHFYALLKKPVVSSSKSGIVTQMHKTVLDDNVITPPQFVINHYTKKKETVVQDAQNNLYLIATNGKILWKKKLDSKIQGKIHQVDLFKNGKLQLAFTTQSSLIVLDRRGNYVPPFLIRSKEEITQPLAVFDYDKNKDYRFVIVKGNKLTMYNKTAKQIKGFEFNQAKTTIVNSPKHIRIGTKDYILVQEKGAKLHVLHRTGKPRVKVKENIAFSANKMYLYKNKFTTTTTTGKLIEIDQGGKIVKTDLKLSKKHAIAATVKTLVTLSENQLTIKGNKVELDFGIYTAPKIFYINDTIYVTTTDKQTKKIYLFDSSGTLLSGFPVYGESTIDLSDSDNDSHLELVTKGEGNTIVTYKMN